MNYKNQTTIPLIKQRAHLSNPSYTPYFVDFFGVAVLYFIEVAEISLLNAAFLINCMLCPINCSTAKSLPIAIDSFIGSSLLLPFLCIGSKLIFFVILVIRLGISSLFSGSKIAEDDSCRIHKCFRDIISKLCRTSEPIKKECFKQWYRLYAAPHRF